MSKEIIKYYPKILDNRPTKSINVFVTEESARLHNIPIVKDYQSNVLPKKPKSRVLKKTEGWYK